MIITFSNKISYQCEIALMINNSYEAERIVIERRCTSGGFVIEGDCFALINRPDWIAYSRGNLIKCKRTGNWMSWTFDEKQYTSEKVDGNKLNDVLYTNLFYGSRTCEVRNITGRNVRIYLWKAQNWVSCFVRWVVCYRRNYLRKFRLKSAKIFRAKFTKQRIWKIYVFKGCDFNKNIYIIWQEMI